jgi:hypothetical protein
MGNSHKNLLLRNHWANCNQTFVEWSLDGPLPKLCPVIPTSNQDGRQATNRKKGGWNYKKSSLKLQSQSQPKFAEMILGWSPFKIVSVSAVQYPRWPPLLEIEISSNGQNCSILSQRVPKFELYKHNDELFNLYYRIFYELWTFAYFDRLWKLEKRGDEI